MDKTDSIPTEAEVDAQWEECMRRIGDMKLHVEYVIEDYPFGFQNRCRCRMSVEYREGSGYRTRKEVTNKFGNWFKPKRSRYQPHPIVVVEGDFGKRSVAWLRLDTMSGPYIQHANGDEESLCRPPLFRQPQRKSERYWISVNGVHEERVIEADPPALCDAWDRWFDHYSKLAGTLMAFVEQAMREA